MSAFYAFGSGMLEQSLENKRAAAERKFELAKMITPYVLEKKEIRRKGYNLAVDRNIHN